MNKENNYIKIFDTTLRDGEQSPGASMNIEEKLKIAEALEDLKVDIIEAGFPAASKGDYEAVSEISKKIKNSSICALSRASKMIFKQLRMLLKMQQLQEYIHLSQQVNYT